MATTSLQVKPVQSKTFITHKRKNDPFQKSILSIGALAVILIAVALLQFGAQFFSTTASDSTISPLTPLSSFNQPIQAYLSQSTNSPTSFFALADGEVQEPDGEGDKEDELECNDVVKFDGDRCQYVRDNCEAESLLDYMKFAYCSFDPSKGVQKFGLMVMFAAFLILLLMLLSSTADVWLVPSLTVVSNELGMSPAVAGASLLSLANGAPDIITSLASLQQGAEKGEVGLVLGSLSGATMCIAALILGLSLVAAKGNSLLSKSAFLRNMSGLVFCVVPTLLLLWRGEIRYWLGIVIVLLYTCYIVGSIVLLQKQQRRKDKEKSRQRRHTFLSSTTSYRQLFPESDNGDNEAKHSMLKDNQDAFPEESSVNFLSGAQSTTQLSFATDTRGSTLILSDEAGIHHLDTDLESPVGPNDADELVFEGDDDDDDDNDQTYFMEGLYFDPQWSERQTDGKRSQNVFKRNILRGIWFLSWPFSLLRWLSVPSTDHRPDYLRGPKKIAFHISPLFAPLVVVMSLSPELDSGSWWALWLGVGAALAVVSNAAYFFLVMPAVAKYDKKRAEVELYVDSTRDQAGLTEDELHKISDLVLQYHLDCGDNNTNNEQAKPLAMTFYMAFISAIAFCSSVGWLSLFANEIVSILTTIGIMMSISPTFLGLSVLAIGNSIPDGASDISLAKKGHMAIAYSAIWSAPVLSNTVGLGLAIFVATAKTPVIKYAITTQLLVCWFSVFVTLIATIVGFLVIYNRRPPAKFGYFLIGLYGAFLLAALLVEVFKW